MKYCPDCRSDLTNRVVEGRNRVACPLCDFVVWGNPVPVVGALVEYNGGIVLVRPSSRPLRWALPAGYVEDGENAEEATIREVKEETNLDVRIKRLIGTYPIRRPNKGLIYIVIVAQTVGGTLRAGDDAEEAAAFPLLEAVNMLRGTNAGKALESHIAYENLQIIKAV